MKALASCIVVACFLAIYLETRVVSCQFLTSQNVYGTPQYCLFNRLEFVNCNFRFRRTPRPQINHYAAYDTFYRPSGAGPVPLCLIRNRGATVRPIPLLGNDERVKFIFNPDIEIGGELTHAYPNDKLIRYMVRCPAGHLAFYNVTNITMEGRTCFNPHTNQDQCVDSLRFLRPPFGETESCGTDAVSNNNAFDSGTFEVVFRSSLAVTNVGYQVNVVCFKREDGDQEGCTRPGNSTMNSTSAGGGTMNSAGRRKRDLEEFHNKWKRHLSRMRRQTLFVDSRFIRLNVPHGVMVTYTNGQLNFTVEDGEMEYRDPIRNIIFLYTFDGTGMEGKHLGQAIGEGGGPVIFFGPGPMFIVGGYAYFQLFVIDTRGLVPNPEEMVAINQLTQAQFAVVNDEPLPNEGVDLNCIDYNRLGLPVPDSPDSNQCLPGMGRKRRQAEPPRDLSDEDILMAIENENACNPVLRTSAAVTIEYARQRDEARLNRLREQSQATTAPPSSG